MRATIGILLIFGGLLLGYAVLSGKFPPASTSSSSSSGTGESLLTTSTGTNTGTNTGPSKTIISDPLGLPTVKELASAGDLLASNGGMKQQ